jgi:hypothetical protein
MSKAMSVLGSVLFFVAVPGVVAGLIPWLITRWEFRPPFLGIELTRMAGLMLIIAGIPGLVDSFARFALQGFGHASTDRAHAEPRGDGSLSLHAKSDVFRGRQCHLGAGAIVR